MVLQKRLDYGFNGYQVPAMPQATRSARRRGPICKRVEDNKMCAFDLLATVAGSLLLEKGDSSTSIDAKDKTKDLKASSFPQNDDHSGFTSLTAVSKTSDDGEIKNEIGSPCSQIGEGSPVVYKESGICKLDCEASVSVKDESNNKVLIGDGDRSDCVTKAPLISIPSSRDDVKIVSRDDDENSSGCYHPKTTRTRSKFFKQAPRIGDRRIRKILASKYWRSAPKYKDESHSNPDGILKPIYRNRKDSYKRQRSQVAIPFKKRKLYDQRDYFNPSEKGNNGASNSCLKGQGGNGTSFQRRDSHVKLRIKSFRVPELFIEIPETSTVGSLKRTVMEAVTAILGGELHIGIQLQGQKVKDDNITLSQSGIFHDDQLDSLGFTLEPNPSQSPAPLCTREASHFLARDDSQALIMYPSGPAMVEQGASVASPESDEPSSGHFGGSDHDSAPSPTDMSVDKSSSDSKALVTIPEMNVEALAVVPAHRKLKRSEMSQRRIRRPFSVTEVEALVQAVEKLGTGRWRDVKLRAFDDAMHRTYVDLKDKWKTLVHTARISPQQRRGEPVPQELLDRVLNAHAYWSQHQAKQHSDPCLLIQD